MKRWVLCALITIGFACSPEPPTVRSQATVAEAVQERFESLVLAAKALDVEAYLEHLDKERFTALNADGTVVHSFAEFALDVRQQFGGIASYQRLDFDKVKIQVLGPETAVLVNEYRADVVLASGEVVSAAGGGTQVWALADGVWLLASVSSSPGPVTGGTRVRWFPRATKRSGNGPPRPAVAVLIYRRDPFAAIAAWSSRTNRLTAAVAPKARAAQSTK